MPRSLTVRKPHTIEIRQLHQLLEGELRAWQRRRVETILFYAAGLNATDIAAILEVHVHTVYADSTPLGEMAWYRSTRAVVWEPRHA